MLEHWHTGVMTRHAQILDALEPEPVASMNAREARKLNLKVGDNISVETRRGSIKLMLRIDRDIADGMVFVPFCFFEAPANILTNPKLDPYGKIPEFKYCAARVFPVS